MEEVGLRPGLSQQLSLNKHKGERAFQVRTIAWAKGMKGGQYQSRRL